MDEVLTRFPAEDAGVIGAFETRADLDRYTYMNAGCVGEFWTDAVMAHRPRCAGWDGARMRRLGAHFGQGLQLVNVLRDLPRDLQQGRCYLPRADLLAVGLTPEALTRPSAIDALRPLRQTLVDAARAGLLDGLSYTLAVPRREPQLRLASAWPLLIGLATLARLEVADDLLDPGVTIKVPRRELRRLLARSTVLVWTERGLCRLAGRLAAGAAPRGSDR
jgi:farnesyl-diphosphate farnesyltransferase